MQEILSARKKQRSLCGHPDTVMGAGVGMKFVCVVLTLREFNLRVSRSLTVKAH